MIARFFRSLFWFPTFSKPALDVHGLPTLCLCQPRHVVRLRTHLQSGAAPLAPYLGYPSSASVLPLALKLPNSM